LLNVSYRLHPIQFSAIARSPSIFRLRVLNPDYFGIAMWNVVNIAEMDAIEILDFRFWILGAGDRASQILPDFQQKKLGSVKQKREGRERLLANEQTRVLVSIVAVGVIQS
jgi:hypothetical protein